MNDDRRAGSPCAFCGHPEQLHRTRDAQWERLAAGEPVEAVADDYGMSVSRMVGMWVGVDDRLVAEIERLRADLAVCDQNENARWREVWWAAGFTVTPDGVKITDPAASGHWEVVTERPPGDGWVKGRVAFVPEGSDQ